MTVCHTHINLLVSLTILNRFSTTLLDTATPTFADDSVLVEVARLYLITVPGAKYVVYED
jgi:hypothetical protein